MLIISYNTGHQSTCSPEGCSLMHLYDLEFVSKKVISNATFRAVPKRRTCGETF